MHKRLPSTVFLFITVLVIALAGTVVLSTAAESDPFQPAAHVAQATTSPDTPKSCRLPWSDKMDTGSLQIVYNSQDDEFVALGFRYFSDWESQHLMGLRLSSSGQPQGEPIMVTFGDQSTVPAIAYNPTSNRYLAVWGSGIPGRNSGLDAQLLAADLSPAADRIPLNAGNGYWPSVAFNPDDDEFLVVWQEDAPVPPSLSTPTPTPLAPGTTPTLTPTPTLEPTGTPATVTPEPNVQSIFAQRVRGDGTRVGPAVIPVTLGSTSEEAVTTPKVVYNSVNQEYLVVWVQSEPAPGLHGRRLSRTGEPLGEVMPLTASPAVPYRPFLTYNSTDNQYLLVWADARNSEDQLVDVYGTLLSAQGQPMGEPFVIRGTSQYEIPTEAVYNPVANEYLIAWNTEGDRGQETEKRPTLQRLSPQGELLDLPLETSGAVYGIGVDTAQGSYLILERDGYYARPLESGTGCSPVPTPTAATPTPWTTPTPTPGVQQWRGTLLYVEAYEFPSGRKWAKWLVGKPSKEGTTVYEEPLVVVTDLTRRDEHLSRAEVGAEVWVKTHVQTLAIDNLGQLLIEFVSNDVAVLSTTEPTTTATATVTLTPTSTPTATPTSQSYQHRVYVPYLARDGESN